MPEQPHEAEEIVPLRRQLDEARAEAADLRVRLQRAHGALAVWREADPARAFRNQYDYQKLLEETRPDGASGLHLLMELRSLKEAPSGLHGAAADHAAVVQVRALLGQWDENVLVAGEFEARIDDLFLKPFLDSMEAGDEYMTMSSCCCSVVHPPARKLTVEFILGAHGVRARRVDT